jgi:hypothetical protein
MKYRIFIVIGICLGFIIVHFIFVIKDEPKYLMAMPKEYWETLGLADKTMIINSLSRYARKLHPDWKTMSLGFLENGDFYEVELNREPEAVLTEKTQIFCSLP